MEHDSGLRSEGLPVAPSLEPSLIAAAVPRPIALVDMRVLFISALSIILGCMGATAAHILIRLIAFFTNLSFFGRLSLENASPAKNELGWLVVFVPVVGAVVIGFMARYGSKAIRGHGIPEAMEQVLTNQSRIPARVTFLKPLSAAISIGTGGPFGAEGPIIATGGAMGSLIGQLLSTTADERKTLLAAGAAAGMAATFGCPVSAVLLAIELLLFEFKPRSLIPVGLASATAAGIRAITEGTSPVFAIPQLARPGGEALMIYACLGVLTGVVAVAVTRIVYAVEDGFEKLPIHWMWWPALGGIAVGVVGRFAPQTLGVGYENITDIVSSKLAIGTIAILATMKFISWSIALGSGTSGGTLAPLLTIGGGGGALLGSLATWIFPGAGVDVRMAALVGMAALFAGASRALLASVVFAFETTLEPAGILPLLAGCTSAFLASCFLMRQTIMTEKISRRGVRVPAEYAADPLDRIIVEEVASRDIKTIQVRSTLKEIRQWIAGGGVGTAHQGFPVVNETGQVLGVLTRRDLLDPVRSGEMRVSELLRRPPIVIYSDCSLREAVDHMVNHDVGRLPVVARQDSGRLVGFITRSDILSAYRRRIAEGERVKPVIGFRVGRGGPANKIAC